MYGDPSLSGDLDLDQWELLQRQQQQAQQPMPPSLLPVQSAPMQRPDYGTPMPTSLVPTGPTIQQRDDQANAMAAQAHQDDIDAGNIPDDRPVSRPVTPDTDSDQTSTSQLPSPEPVAPHPTTNRESVAQWDPQVQAASMAHGVPVNVIRAIMDMESGGKADAVSAAGAQGLMQVMSNWFQTGEDSLDPTTNIDRGTKILADNYAHYGDWNKAAAAYFGAIDEDGNITGAQDATGTDGYGYVDKFRGLSSTYADQGTGPLQGPNEPDKRPLNTQDLRPSQFGDDQLSAAEAYSACGPAAAIAFAAMYGQYPTLRQAVDIASKIGAWDQGEGMHGPDAEVRLIEAMGGKAKLSPGFDAQQVAAEVEGGNPVIVDAPGHYGVISKYDPTTNKFYFGTSATDLKGGSPWMTIDEYQALNAVGGPIRATLFADNPLGPGQSYAAAPGPSTAPPNWKPGSQEDPAARQAREDSEAAQKLAADVNASVEKQMQQARETSQSSAMPTDQVATSPTIQPDSSTPSWMQQGLDWIDQKGHDAVDWAARQAQEATAWAQRAADPATQQAISNRLTDEGWTIPAAVFDFQAGEASGAEGRLMQIGSGISNLLGSVRDVADDVTGSPDALSSTDTRQWFAQQLEAHPEWTKNHDWMDPSTYASPQAYGSFVGSALPDILAFAVGGAVSETVLGAEVAEAPLLTIGSRTLGSVGELSGWIGSVFLPSVGSSAAELKKAGNTPEASLVGGAIIAAGETALAMAVAHGIGLAVGEGAKQLGQIPDFIRDQIEKRSPLDLDAIFQDSDIKTRADLRARFEAARTGVPIPTGPSDVTGIAQPDTMAAVRGSVDTANQMISHLEDTQQISPKAALQLRLATLRDFFARGIQLSDNAVERNQLSQLLLQADADLQRTGKLNLAPGDRTVPTNLNPVDNATQVGGNTSLVRQDTGPTGPLTPSDRPSSGPGAVTDLAHSPVATPPTTLHVAVPLGPPARLPNVGSDRTSGSEPTPLHAGSSTSAAFEPHDITVGSHQVVGSEGIQPGGTSLMQLQGGSTVSVPNDVTVRGQALVDARGRVVGQRIPDEQLTTLGNRPYAQQSVALARAVLPGVQAAVDRIAQGLGHNGMPHPAGQISELMPGAVNVHAANDFQGNIGINPWHGLQVSLARYKELYPDHPNVDPNLLAPIFASQMLQAVGHEAIHSYNTPEERGLNNPRLNTPAKQAAHFNDPLHGVHGLGFHDIEDGFNNWVAENGEEYQKLYQLALEQAHAILSEDHGNIQQFSADATALRQSGTIGRQREPILLHPGDSGARDLGTGPAAPTARSPESAEGGGTRVSDGAGLQRGEGGGSPISDVQGTHGLEPNVPASGERAVEPATGSGAESAAAEPKPAVAAQPEAGAVADTRPTHYSIGWDRPITSVKDLGDAVFDTLKHWAQQPKILPNALRIAGIELRANVMATGGPDLANDLFHRGNKEIIVDDLKKALIKRGLEPAAIQHFLNAADQILGASSSEAAKYALANQIGRAGETPVESAPASTEGSSAPNPQNRTSNPTPESTPAAAPRTPTRRARATQAKLSVDEAVDKIGDHESIRTLAPQEAANLGAKINQDLVVNGDVIGTFNARQSVVREIDRQIRNIRSVSHTPPNTVLDSERSELRRIGRDERNKYWRNLRQIRSTIAGSQDIVIPNFRDINDPDTGAPMVRMVQMPGGDSYKAVTTRLGSMEANASSTAERRAFQIRAQSIQNVSRTPFTGLDDEPITMSQYLQDVARIRGYDDTPEGMQKYYEDTLELARTINSDSSITHGLDETLAVLLQADTMQLRDMVEGIRLAAEEDAKNNATMENGQNANETYTGPATKAAMDQALELLQAGGVQAAIARTSTAMGRGLRMLSLAAERRSSASNLELLRQTQGQRSELESITKKLIAALQRGEKRGDNRLLENIQGYQNGEISLEQLRQLPEGKVAAAFFEQVRDFPGYLDALSKQGIIPLAEQIAGSPFLSGLIPDVKLVRQIQTAVEQYAKSGVMPSLPEDRIRAAVADGSNILKAARRAEGRARNDSGISKQAAAKAAYRQTEAGWKELLNHKVARSAKNALAQTQEYLNDLESAVKASRAANAVAINLQLVQKLADERNWLMSRGHLTGVHAQDEHLMRGGMAEPVILTSSEQKRSWLANLGILADGERATDTLISEYNSRLEELARREKQGSQMTPEQIKTQRDFLEKELTKEQATRDSIAIRRETIRGQMLERLVPEMAEEFNHLSAIAQEQDRQRENATDPTTMERFLEAKAIEYLGARETAWITRDVIQQARSGLPLTVFEQYLREQTNEHWHATADEARTVQHQLALLGDLQKEFGSSEDASVQMLLEDVQMRTREAIDNLQTHGEEGRNVARALESKYIATVYGHGGSLVTGLLNYVRSNNYAIESTMKGPSFRAYQSDLAALDHPGTLMKLAGTEEQPGPVRRLLEGLVTGTHDVNQARADVMTALDEIEKSAPLGLGRAFKQLLGDALNVEEAKVRIADFIDMVDKNPNDLALRAITEAELHGLHDIVTNHEVDPWFRKRYSASELALTRAYDNAVKRGADALMRAADETWAKDYYLAQREAGGTRIKGAELSKEEEADIKALGKKSVFEVLTERAEKDRVSALSQDVQALRRQLWAEPDQSTRADIFNAIERRLDELETVGEVLVGSDRTGIGSVAAQRFREQLMRDDVNESIKAMVRQQGWADKDEIKQLSDRINLLHEVLYGRSDGRVAKLFTDEAAQLTDLRTRSNIAPETITPEQEEIYLNLLKRGVALTASEEAALTQALEEHVSDLANIGFSMDSGYAEGSGLDALKKLNEKLTTRESLWADRAQIAEARAQISWLANEMWKEPDYGVRQAFVKQIEGALGYIRGIKGTAGDLGSKAAARIEMQLKDMEIHQLGMGDGTVGKAEISQDRAELRAEIAAQRQYVTQLHNALLKGYGGAEEASIQAELTQALYDLSAIGANRTEPSLKDLGQEAYTRALKELGIREDRLDLKTQDRVGRRTSVLAVRELRQEAFLNARRLIEQPGSIAARENLSRALSTMRTIQYDEHVQREVSIRNAKGGLVRKEIQTVTRTVNYGEVEAAKIAEQVGLRSDSIDNILQASTAPSLTRATTQGGIAGLRDRLKALRQAGTSTNTLGEFRSEVEALLDGLKQFGETGRKAAADEARKNQLQGVGRSMQSSDPDARAKLSAFYSLIDTTGTPAQTMASVRQAMRIISNPNYATFYREWGLVSLLMSPVSWGLTGAHTVSKATNSVITALRWALRLGVDKSVASLTGGERSVYGSEFGAFVNGAWRAKWDVANDARQIWWYGNAQRQIANAQATGDMGRVRNEDLVNRWGPKPDIKTVSSTSTTVPSSTGLVAPGTAAVTSASSTPRTPNILDRLINDGHTENLSQRILFLLGSVAQMGSLRIFRASDELIGGIAYAGALEAQIERKAQQLSVSRAYVRQHITEYPDIIQAAGKIRENLLLQHRSDWLKGMTGLISRKLGRGRADQTFLQQAGDIAYSTYLPFTTIPANIIQQGLSLSGPGAVVHGVQTMRALSAGGGTVTGAATREAAAQGVTVPQLISLDPTQSRARARAQEEAGTISDKGSKALLAGLAFAAAIALAAKGLLTPDDPTDREGLESNEAEHVKGRSIWLGDGQYSLEGTSLVIPFMMVANAFDRYEEAFKKLTGQRPEDASVFQSLGVGTAAGVLGATTATFHNFFLQNLLGPISTITDPRQRETLPTIGYNLASPLFQHNMPAIFDYIARIGDDWERDTRVDNKDDWYNQLGLERVEHSIEAHIPGLREGLPIRQDQKGNMVPNSKSPGLISGFWPHGTQQIHDDLYDILKQYGEHYPDAPTQLQPPGVPQGTKIPITLAEQRLWQQKIDTYLRDQVEKTLSNEQQFNTMHPSIPGLDQGDTLAKQQQAQMHLASTLAQHHADQDVFNSWGSPAEQAAEIARRVAAVEKKQALNSSPQP